MPTEPAQPSADPAPSDEQVPSSSIADVIAPLKERRESLVEQIAALTNKREHVNKIARESHARITADAERDRKIVNAEIARLRTELDQIGRFLNAEHPRKRTPKAGS